MNHQLFTPLASTEELEDKNSWINNKYEWPREPYVNICFAIGEAMLAWAQLEMSLYGIFAFSLNSKRERGADATWSTLTGFRLKLELTDKLLVAAKIEKHDPTAWEKLKTSCGKKSKQRNAIAHGTLFYDHNENKPQRKFFLSTADSSGSIKSRQYFLDVVAAKNAFLATQSELNDYWLQLANN